ncbi:DUF1700 domain-containing protein [Enterococcus sp. DIV0242_7C1]|uniref:DUF1700 domain-containing protein n=1 Tax=Candidatus Enterococcus dunnyi TaxID=1834192 RepID=A0A200IVD4_9ENTE|nr:MULTISPECIES: DUF1700 domain-containing protein [unclassified Enterococcus]MBO0471283.1 DUF1700 domain-containing protein [Enterococcus sp. DIV0242_7C1]MCA5013884.1 DUF1700 domain-containing protein [Enterococcus sp. S23]MCA5017342.1 DUF1700 domain-containing protein [Enterococcus sp. S22(2020)]OUZ28327.1 hypothetical protein A5889_003082 [Enterococcus sp. 9D6_DIV0238]
MNKEHFLIELKIYLKPLTAQQQAFILEKYDNIFDERLANGEMEEEIAKDLGKPRTIAEEILEEFDITVPEKRLERDGWQEIPPATSYEYYEETAEHPYDQAYQSYERPKHNGFVRFCQISGVILLNFLLMFWFIFSFAMLLFSGWFAAILFLFSPILGGISIFTGLNDASMFEMFVSVFLCGAGIIGLLILAPLTRFFGKVLKRYMLWNIRVLRGDI